MPRRSGFNFFGTRNQVKVLLLGEKRGKDRGYAREPYYDRAGLKQVFGTFRRSK